MSHLYVCCRVSFERRMHSSGSVAEWMENRVVRAIGATEIRIFNELTRPFGRQAVVLGPFERPEVARH